MLNSYNVQQSHTSQNTLSFILKGTKERFNRSFVLIQYAYSYLSPVLGTLSSFLDESDAVELAVESDAYPADALEADEP